MLIVDTSGLVYPAASLPQIAKSCGAGLVGINMMKPELTSICDVFVKGPASEIMMQMIEKLNL